LATCSGFDQGGKEVKSSRSDSEEARLVIRASGAIKLRRTAGLQTRLFIVDTRI
jgi:hypothetical protein